MNIDGLELRNRLDRFAEAFRKKGIKLTIQRMEIFREIAASLEHPDADTIYRSVRKRLPTVSPDTVYRTLRVLNDLGLIDTLSPRGNSLRFDANLKPHHHFVCLRCGFTRDFESPGLDSLNIPESAKAFGRVIGSRLEVRGICEDCLNNAASLGPQKE